MSMCVKARAISHPEEILVITIDGSDHPSYATPCFSQVTMDSCSGWRMRLKLVGALVTGRLLHYFTFGGNWDSGKVVCPYFFLSII